jgi:hypothetical protein
VTDSFYQYVWADGPQMTQRPYINRTGFSASNEDVRRWVVLSELHGLGRKSS